MNRLECGNVYFVIVADDRVEQFREHIIRIRIFEEVLQMKLEKLRVFIHQIEYYLAHRDHSCCPDAQPL